MNSALASRAQQARRAAHDAMADYERSRANVDREKALVAVEAWSRALTALKQATMGVAHH